MKKPFFRLDLFDTGEYYVFVFATSLLTTYFRAYPQKRSMMMCNRQYAKTLLIYTNTNAPRQYKRKHIISVFWMVIRIFEASHVPTRIGTECARFAHGFFFRYRNRVHNCLLECEMSTANQQRDTHICIRVDTVLTRLVYWSYFWLVIVKLIFFKLKMEVW